ncbi:T9SS type A sorting domain-containing protein [Marivirga arenosa]|uniref:T9SS type A sorting domain-containing protein n=1 Tax=Marivirga arenosa TaxID=3059076 RepID=A0AA49GDI0_9BACT|nr:T9SS type A sorting domain-containing protein [Marivirga sp. BKB1-2]WKK82093.2 T9SS type A sorting domain-containing protein [Marivirga sp. BKB1-2]
MRVLLFITFIFYSFLTEAQYRFIPYQDVPLSNSSEMEFPWAGGLNGVQWGKIDLNNDGFLDLAGFDRSSGRILCFLNIDGEYEYAPEYEMFFPSEIQNFFILKDYNQDGKMDVFTAGNLGITAYENISTGGLPQWSKTLDFIRYTSLSGNDVNLQVNFNDYPFIGDLDDDGDLDILNFNFSGIESRILFYQNNSIETNGTASLNSFELVDNYWGTVEDCDCGVFAFNGQDCQDILGRVLNNKARHAGGKSISVFDFDKDGVLELVTSHEECNELYYFNNSALSNLDPNFEGFTSSYPSSNNPAQFNFYPNTMVMDLTGDASEDLIISPNIEGNIGSPVNFSSSNWLYQNVGNGYELVSKKFLQEDMIDWGAQASPAFLDYDEDRDLDLFIAYTDINSNEVLESAIAFYENVGDTQNPSFELQDSDFLNISQEGFANMFIQWQDVDVDGQKDLIIQATSGNSNQLRILFQENNEFDINSSVIIDNVFIGFGYSIHLADVIGDSHPDLLVGKSSGGLILYENIGQGRNPSFQQRSQNYLNIGDDFFRSSLRVNVMDIDNDNQQDLITSDFSGNIRVFPNLQNNTGQFDTLYSYNELIQNFDQIFFGKRNNPVFAPIFNDDYPTLILGTVSGGLRVFRNNAEYEVESGEELVFQIYPNPNENNLLFIKANQDISISIATLNGQTILSNLEYSAFGREAIDVSQLQSGLYIVSALFANGKNITRKLVIP